MVTTFLRQHLVDEFIRDSHPPLAGAGNHDCLEAPRLVFAQGFGRGLHFQEATRIRACEPQRASMPADPDLFTMAQPRCHQGMADGGSKGHGKASWAGTAAWRISLGDRRRMRQTGRTLTNAANVSNFLSFSYIYRGFLSSLDVFSSEKALRSVSVDLYPHPLTAVLPAEPGPGCAFPRFKAI